METEGLGSIEVFLWDLTSCLFPLRLSWLVTLPLDPLCNINIRTAEGASGR